MSNFVSFLLVVPIIVWSVFQPALYANAMIVEQGISSVIYETQKEASLKGRYDEDIYKDIKDKLVEVHNFDPNKIEIKGTETVTMRGDRMEIEVTVPKPKTNVIEAFSSGVDEPYHYKKYVMSEYTN